jgi:hypothetical protein
VGQITIARTIDAPSCISPDSSRHRATSARNIWIASLFRDAYPKLKTDSRTVHPKAVTTREQPRPAGASHRKSGPGTAHGSSFNVDQLASHRYRAGKDATAVCHPDPAQLHAQRRRGRNIHPESSLGCNTRVSEIGSVSKPYDPRAGISPDRIAVRAIWPR